MHFLLIVSLAQTPLGTYSDAFLARSSRTAPRVDYTLSILDNRSAYVVELTIANAPNPTRLIIPEWAPGAYRLMAAASNIADFTAQADGRSLAITRDSGNAWVIQTFGAARVTVRYTTAVRDPAEWTRANNRWYLRQHSGLVDGPRTFMYLDGAKLAPSHVTFQLPAGWSIGTGLVPTTDPAVYWAPSYDVLIDSPVLLGRFATWRFTAAGVPHRAVVDLDGGQAAFDTTAFVDMLRRICTEAIGVFGSAPYKDYTFIFAGAGGGLEHLNSTTIGINLSRMAANPRAHENVTAHEFFHAWNVKRIRPVELGPFDYTQPVRTLNLWISEGVTDYYADLILVRSGLDSVSDFRRGLAQSIVDHRRNPARLVISPQRSSWTTWDGPEVNDGLYISYYLQGELLGFLLDLVIRDSTDNRRSLDDVMRHLFDQHAGERGFTSDDFLTAVQVAAGLDLRDFARRYVSGTEEIPWNDYLRRGGWQLDTGETRRPDIRITTLPPAVQGGPPRIVVLPGSAARAAGLQSGDEVLEVNGRRITVPGDVSAALQGVTIGGEVVVRARRARVERTVRFSVPAVVEMTATLGDLPAPTERMRRVRIGILTGR